MKTTLHAVAFAVCLLAAGIVEATTADEALAAVVMIEGSGGQCSAVVIEPGVLLTAKHCLAKSADRVVTRGNARIVRSMPAQAPNVDGARLYAPGVTCPCIETSRWALIGDVIAIGFPSGRLRSTTGIMLGYGKFGPAFERAVAHSAAIRAGASGGALIQKQGNGYVLVAILMGYNEGGSFAVLAEDIE